MLTTNDIKTWLQNANCSIQAVVSCPDKYPHIAMPKTKYLGILKKHLPTQYSESLSKDLLSALKTHRANRNDKILGLHINPLGLTLDYYSFGLSDDKYFLVNEALIAYQDTQLYSDFYRTLPGIHTDPIPLNFKRNELIILPRAQYGHYIYDEVLPQLICYFEQFKSPPRNIAIIESRHWQSNVVSSLCQSLFATYSFNARIIKLEACNNRYKINGGILAIPVPVATYYEASNLLDQQTLQTTKVNRNSLTPIDQNHIIMLTRDGFDRDDQRRIINHADLYNELRTRHVQFIKPHRYNLYELKNLLANASKIISEPGTTPLIGYLAAPPGACFINLLSMRCLLDCDSPYFYSGWRYHLPWLSRIQSIIWGNPLDSKRNPFSDCCTYSVNQILASISQ